MNGEITTVGLDRRSLLHGNSIGSTTHGGRTRASVRSDDESDEMEKF